jgi:ParB-like chromosome segregation protein Spo0J
VRKTPKNKPSKSGVKALKLSAITADDALQPRASFKLNDEHVADLVEAIKRGDQLPPLVVYHDKTTGKYWLSEGFHRHAAYRKAGRKEAPCEVRIGDRKAARVNAAGSNREHNALKRTNADKRRAVEILLEEHPKRAARQIAEAAGVSNTFVSTVRKERNQKPPPATADVQTAALSTNDSVPVRTSPTAGEEESTSVNGIEESDEPTGATSEPASEPLGQKPDTSEPTETVRHSDDQHEQNSADVTAQLATEVTDWSAKLDGMLDRFAKRYGVEAVYKAALVVGLPHLYDPETRRWAPTVARVVGAFVRALVRGADK